MPLAVFCRTLLSPWRSLSQQLWPDTPQHRNERELARLKGELSRRYRRLLQRRCRIEQLRARLSRQEQQLDELSRQPHDAPGERAESLESSLQQLQRAARRNRDRLFEHEQAYSAELDLLEQKKHLRLAMLRGEIVVIPRNDAD
jgi:hypothetical protein